MLDRSQVRPTLNQGRYLFFNPWLRGAIGLVDRLLAVIRPAPGNTAEVSPRRILLAMQAHIGDAIVASSAVPVLRAAFPDAKIGVLVHPGSVAVFEDNPDIAWVHRILHWKLDRRPLPLLRRLKDYVDSRQAALASIRAVGYDLSIDLYAYFPNSIPLLHACGIPTRIGWSSGGFGGLLTHAVEWPDGPERPVVEWHRQLLATMPACRPLLALARPTLHHSEAALANWRASIDGHAIPPRYTVFHVGAGAPMKLWPEQHWRELGQRWAGRGDRILLLGYGSDEEALCTRLCSAIPNSINLAGKLGWKEMCACIAGAQRVVGHDSAAVHVAAAWDVPGICIATGINAEAWKPFSDKAQWVVTPTPCSPCHLPAGCAGMECIRMTSVDSVDQRLKLGDEAR